jgi:glucuronate isomerase
MVLEPNPIADRYFAPDPAQIRMARALYEATVELPIVSPHGHVDPRLLADPDATFGTPTDLFIIPDHYILRMLYSQGIGLEALGVPVRDRRPAGPSTETDHRRVWQLFADNIHLFRATPSGLWFADALREVFGIGRPLTSDKAGDVYDELSTKLALPDYRPRALFERARIETLCTTDDAADALESHRAIRASGWPGDVRPTFRPDGVVNILAPGWRDHLTALSAAVGREIGRTTELVAALEERRTFFRAMGAVATDHGVESAYAAPLSETEADSILDRAFRGDATLDDARRFCGHMLMELARMSLEDGLVMQLHVGSFRNHNRALFERFGPDIGGDIPVAAEFTRNLKPLLDRFGNDPRLTLILFTLDETAYAREIAPLAGHYPALRVGPPWWFHDSLNGMARYLDQVIETAGLYNTVGFNDDTRAFCSIPVRHDVWRRAAANWLAGLVVRGIVAESDALAMAAEMAYGLAKRAYRLDGNPAPWGANRLTTLDGNGS